MQSFNSSRDNPRRSPREGKLVTVGRVEDVPDGRAATIELEGGGELALYHVGGDFFCLENFCPHKGAPLADGNLQDHAVECDWHGWRFDFRTGACINRPGEDVESYEVLIEDGWIKVVV
ncbi:MAG: Rieske 2Fe-2S domain-containing protein [Acidobacteria bacterium]|nr:Rieske 2Fe-2S domain-containing protein [Acidobacteriota bacterium]